MLLGPLRTWTRSQKAAQNWGRRCTHTLLLFMLPLNSALSVDALSLVVQPQHPSSTAQVHSDQPSQSLPYLKRSGREPHGGCWVFLSACHPSPLFRRQHLDSPLGTHFPPNLSLCASCGSHSSSDPRGEHEIRVWPIKALHVLPNSGHSGAFMTGKERRASLVIPDL